MQEDDAPKLDTSLVVTKLNGSVLRPGDVILTAERSLASLLIRFGTTLLRFRVARWSHCIIYAGSGVVVEAVPSWPFHMGAILGGEIWPRSIERLRFRNADAIVLRLKDELGSEAIATKAAQFAHNSIANGYHLSGVLTFPFGSGTASPAGEKYCSELIMRAYSDAGKVLARCRLCYAGRPFKVCGFL